MAKCHEDFAGEKNSLNDAEVSDTLSKDNRISPYLREKPLSPILTGGLNNRKFLIGKRLSCKKSARVKLSDRFKENNKEEYFVVKPVNVPIPVSFDDNLSASQTEILINHLDKLEELDNSRKNIYKVLVRDKKTNNDNFKRPLPPLPTEIDKTDSIKRNNISATVENESSCQRSVLNEVIPLSPKTHSVGFQTATGKHISLSETDVKKYSKLFEDIIYPTQSYNEGRQNKHTFLRKNNSIKQNVSKPGTANAVLNDDNLRYVKSDETIKLIQPNRLETNLPTSKSSIKLTENSVAKAKHIFADERFDDIKFNNENLCGFRRASVQAFVSHTDASKESVNNLDSYKDVELTLTQAISESGVSNTQILSAVDNILESIEGNEEEYFRGFTKYEMTDSYRKLLDFERVLEHSRSIHEFSKKRKRSKSFVSEDYVEKFENGKENSQPCKKRLRNSENIIPEVNFIENKQDIMSNNNFRGFASASGKAIAVPGKYVKDAEAIFSDIDFDVPLKKFKPNVQKNVFSKNINEVKSSSFVGFQKASGKSIELSENSLKKAKTMFDKLDVEISKENASDKAIASGSTSTGLAESNTLKEKYDKFATEFFTEHTENDNYERKFVGNPFTSGFCKASGKAVNVSENAFKKAKNVYDNLSIDQDDHTLVASTSISAEHAKNSSVTQNSNISKHTSLSEELSASDVTPVNLHKPKPTSLSAKNSKRKLGMSHFKQIQICDNKLDKAKSLFDEDFSGISPIKPRQTVTYTSTPIRQNNYLTSVNDNDLKPKTTFSSFVDAAGITPIKMDPVEIKRAHIPFSTDSKILCTSPSKDNWIDDLEAERRKLESKLQVLLERETRGREMLHIIKNGKSDSDKKPRKGLLYRTKTTSNKISLVTFVNNRRPGEIAAEFGLLINPKNAENLHFSEQFYSSLTTGDGAVVIPNSKDMIGLSEIKNAFEAMPGIELRLVPKDWIRNHYKWIIWKLTNYENKFPSHFGGCLNIENIIQQLKYRYDREIDRAERPAIRKICEKDDAPQKRIVLCVSDIKKLDTKKYELELCDGWYAIRTIIDEPLCKQITKGKIEVGTKLLISGAELLNCDGCHPLEATNLVCLKINYNCTRRSIWHAKLGFQRNPNPFPIQLQSVHHLGGTIAAIKVCIVRVYPLRYMEKVEGRSVWRNKKAEEIAAQKWENKRIVKLEQVQNEVRKKFENLSSKSGIHHRSNDSDLSNIKCPKELYDILENSNDPEYLQQNLSASQKESLLNYQSNLSMKKQQEIAAEINAGISKLKMERRDVAAVLKLLIIDVMGDSDRFFNFFIWRPTEAHLQGLREGKFFTIQNVLPRLNGDLNSTSKTAFKLEPVSTDKCSKFKRRLVQLVELVTLKSPPDFNEFDTVGIVVQTKIESHSQEVWITDNKGRLLFITIYEGPDTCSLLDNLKRGHATTVCNLIYRGLKKDIVQAVANHFTVFSSYSQYKHLQEGLEVFKRETAKDVKTLLDDCDNKIEIFRIISDINCFSANFEAAGEDIVTSRSSLLA